MSKKRYIDYESIQNTISLSEDIERDVCDLHLNQPSGFERVQRHAQDATRTFNVLFQLLCEEHRKLNYAMRKGAQDLRDTDREEERKYHFPRERIWDGPTPRNDTPGNKSNFGNQIPL